MEILLNDLVCFSLFSIKSSNKIKTNLRTVHVLNKKNQKKKKKKQKKKKKKIGPNASQTISQNITEDSNNRSQTEVGHTLNKIVMFKTAKNAT